MKITWIKTIFIRIALTCYRIWLISEESDMGNYTFVGDMSSFSFYMRPETAYKHYSNLNIADWRNCFKIRLSNPSCKVDKTYEYTTLLF